MTRNSSKALEKDQQSTSHDAMEGKSAKAFWSNLEKKKNIDEYEATLTKEWLQVQILYFKTKRKLLELEKRTEIKGDGCAAGAGTCQEQESPSSE